ncbi:vomeronasal 1 receptor ornAnaV1R3066 [Ornithorhynchus anatinus]|uniref:Vomeronasal type-1 receptor n=1 Tax=Ornithorhynchus anatinus TaxID=9258 RepID=F7DYI6_ORNAN|nr:vomeronasal 1 receptor ornAnaV1R3066 [Ornithorhynchus anatinus]
MLVSDLVLGIFSLSQASLGLLGNSTLFLVYAGVFFSQAHSRKPTDLILAHLTMANTITLLTQGVPAMIMIWGQESTSDSVSCRIIIYIRRVSRGLSICTTCLLSVFQAITISPSTSSLAPYKQKAPKYILYSFFFFWILNSSMYINILATTETIKHVNNTVSSYDIRYGANIFWMNFINDVAFLSTITFRDVFFVFLMTWSSGYMVMVLHRHRKQVQHIHSTSLSPTSSVETRVTHTILLLVTCFVVFYCINCTINLFLTFVEEEDYFRLNDTKAFLAICYPSLCPLVLINSDRRVPRPHCVLKRVIGPSPPLDFSEREQVSSIKCSLPTARL